MADPLYFEHLTQIGDALDHHKSCIDAMGIAASRPMIDVSVKASSAPFRKYKHAFNHYLRKTLVNSAEAPPTFP